MFSYPSNYLLFFYNYELIIPTCFFFFIFFVLIFDQGQIGNGLKQVSVETKKKIWKQLEIRERMIKELATYLKKSLRQIKSISQSYEKASQDILFTLQYIIKKLTINTTVLRVKYHNDLLIYRTNLLTLEIKNYFTQEFCTSGIYEKTYDLRYVSDNVKEKNIKYKVHC